MTELKFISPMLDHFAVGGSISDHHGVRCYPAMDETTGNKYIVKVISIPPSRTQLDAFLLSGAYADEASALVYFKEQAEEVMKEVEVLDKLSQLEGFLPYEKSQLVPMEDDVGLNVYLLGSYKHTLERTMQKQPMTQLAAINLGLDLCAALTVCRRSGYLYADLKPGNIFVTGDNAYRIGDLGFLRLDSLKYASLPDKYRSSYTAPEIADAYSSLNTTIDVYAVGKILYQIYNNGELPAIDPEAPKEPLPAPANADYEMSEIILKACAPDPADRWEDPAQMGQALVSYMQRNGANDTPIVPPVIPVSEEAAPDPQPSEVDAAEATVEAAETADNEKSADTGADISAIPDFQDEELGNLSVLLQPSGDETAPENNETNVDYDEVSEEITEILAQADEIANHPVPEPPVAPDPVEIPIPAPLPIEDVPADDVPAEEAPDETETVEAADTEADAAETSEDTENTETADVTESGEETAAVTTAVADTTQASAEAAADESQEEEAYEEPAPAKKKKRNWLLYVILVLLIAGLVALGTYFYTNYYLLPINTLTVEGKEDYVTVTVDTPVDESLLTVVCKGQHGDVFTAPLQNGTATFTGLKDDTGYVISLSVSGFHKLTGETSKGYATPQVTAISDFKVTTGSVSGSVNVSFTVTGKDAEGWQLSYSAAGESLKKIELQGKNELLTGLTVGKQYTFTLEPTNDVYLTGENKITQTVLEPAYAQFLTVTGCKDDTLSVSWLAPKNIATGDWIVVCTGSSDSYSKELKVSSSGSTTATFEGIDPALSYTVTVTAEGMQDGVTTTKPADAPSLSNVKLTETATGVSLTWDDEEDLGALTVTCTADGLQIGEAVTTTDGQFQVDGLIPNAIYCIAIKSADGIIPLGGIQAFATDAAAAFTVTYGGITTTAKDMTFDLCAPESDKKGWSSEYFTNEFKVGEDAGLLIQLTADHGYSQEEITRVFAIYDKEGKLVKTASTQEQWYNMWWSDSSNRACHLSIPVMPDDPGEYTLCLYFNGQLVTEQEFTITQ